MVNDPYGFRAPINNNQDYLYAQRERNVQDVMQNIRSQHDGLYYELEQEGLNRNVIDMMFYFVVNYIMSQQIENMTADQVYSRLQNQIPWSGLMLRQFNIPRNRLDRILIRLIEIVLELIRDGGGQPGPGPGPGPGQGWSAWEDLGGVLSTSPSVSSWQPNRLDVFAGGSDNAMYHKWWDGRSWSIWENLGGILTSAPAAISWGPDRIDVFVRGTDNCKRQVLFHK